MRTFVDETGTEWVVWEVRPEQALEVGADGAPTERRCGADRRGAPAPEPVIERRRWAERRMQAHRLVRGMASALAGGWLAFQSGAVRRRLTPIPGGWARLSDAALAALCHRAAPIARASLA